MHALDTSEMHPFSLDPALLTDILRHARPLGHNEDRQTLNLGFGFLYYGLVRALRPKHVLVVGSGFGFSVVCLALGLRDNRRGRLTFVDPSFSIFRDGPFHTIGGQSQWDNPEKVRAHFARFGVEGIVTHYKLTSEELFRRYDELALAPIDLAFIDGNHSYKDVSHDFIETAARSRKNAYILLHDTNIYLRELVRHAGVKRWLKELSTRDDDFEALDFPFASGLAVIRLLQDSTRLRTK